MPRSALPTVIIVLVALVLFVTFTKLFLAHFMDRAWQYAGFFLFGLVGIVAGWWVIRREQLLIADRVSQRKTEDQLRLQAAALTSAANAIVITRNDGTIEWVNPAFTRITGYSPEEVEGKNPKILKSGRHDNTFYRNLWTTISAGGVWHGEVMNRRKDGRLYVEEMTITPVESYGGGITHYVAVKNDVTARKQAEDDLARAEEQYRSIFDNAVVGIFRCNLDSQFFMMNRAMSEMLGYDSPGQAIDGINGIGLFSDQSQKEGKTGNPERPAATLHNVERACRRKDGTQLWLSVNLHCVHFEDGNPAYYEGTAEDITARKQAEETLQESEEKLRIFIEHAPAALAMFDREMCYLQASNRYRAEFNLGERDLRGLSHYEVFPNLPERWKQAHRRGLAGEVLREYNDRFIREDGTDQWLRWEIRPWYDSKGVSGGIVLFTEDITERTLLENQLRQAQKMDAVGRLAGGVAHDFNNMLGVITGYSEMLKLNAALDAATLAKIDQIHSAAKKAASLTQQLLAFSRKQIVQPQILDLNEVVSNLSKMLKRLIGEDISLELHPSSERPLVKVDPNQIEQVIMNLAVNARDAMPNGGRLTIETDVCDLDAAFSMKHRPIAPGRYVRLTVNDNGTGMDKETISHLFEPFFTTKELGRGTGLGLSIVYGIVKQSQGYVWVYSEPGQGASFKLCFPLQSGRVQAAPPPLHIDNVRGTERILIVEDDQALRSLEVVFLRELGYQVLEAETGERALEIAMKETSPIQVMITDLYLPGVSGRELAERLLITQPGLKVIYTSGYTHDRLMQTRSLSAEEVFLQKPFALSELSKKLRQRLQSERGDVKPKSRAASP